jgi:hypothetical protein
VGFKLDTGANGSLEFNGDNIKVPSAEITINYLRLKFSKKPSTLY